ncbi:hypothetical protein [Mucilaginibacter sp.]
MKIPLLNYVNVDHTEKKSASVIVAGFAGLSVTTYFSKAGYRADVYEKNIAIAGCTQQLITEDYTIKSGKISGEIA